MWPPKWQEETDEFKAAMAFRETEIMKIPGKMIDFYDISNSK